VTIENALTGLEAHSSSGGLYSGTHILDTGGSVSASYSSNINLYTNQSPNWVELCGIDDAHLAAGYGAYIIATNCSYDNGIPVINEYQGTVDVFGAYNCSGSSNSAVVAANPHQEGVNSAQGDDPALVEFREANNLFFDLSRRVNDDISATGEFDRGKFSSEYVNVINKFKSFIDKNPSSALSKTALTTAVHCFRALEDQDAMKSFLKRIKDHARLSKVSGLAKRFMIDYLSRRKDFDNAIVTANEIIEEQAGDKDLVCDVLFAKGLIYSHDLNQPAEAAQCFSNIINNYPDNPLVKLAGKELELLGYDDPKSAKQTAAGDGAQIMEFSAANYPNPFNPATEIRYALPSDGQVTIRIFNILGEQVRVVTDEFKFAGRYKVVWDGKNNQDVQVASGVYIYRISYVPSAEASGNVQPIVRTGKMNLLR
jgi:tetratricopeptide (TPR) repeat protein